MVLRDEENRVATRTFFVNEARDGKEPTVAWRALRGREATCGQAVLWGWELVRDVEPGDEVLTTYEEDASGMPETRPDERSGTADALASIGGVPRNLQGCGYLVASAPRRAGAVDRSSGIEDRHLQIAVRESLRDAKAAKLRVPGCPCRDLETGQRCKATRGGGSWYTITLATARRRRGARNNSSRSRSRRPPSPPRRPQQRRRHPRRPRPRRRRPRRPRTRRRSRTPRSVVTRPSRSRCRTRTRRRPPRAGPRRHRPPSPKRRRQQLSPLLPRK